MFLGFVLQKANTHHFRQDAPSYGCMRRARRDVGSLDDRQLKHGSPQHCVLLHEHTTDWRT